MDEPIRLGELLRRHGLRLRKELGQNFLTDPVHLERIVAAAEITGNDQVLEIGAGVGTLTRYLAARAGHVVALELDERFLPVLQETLADLANVTIVQGDILASDPAEIVGRGEEPVASYKVVANLPYYITSAVLRHLLTARRPPALVVVTVQREVAQRIVARPPAMSLLAVGVQFYARAEIVARIPAGAFYPPPKVDSAVLRLRPWSTPPISVPDEALFFQVVRAGFSQRRKQLRNALASRLHLRPAEAAQLLQQAGIAPHRRAQTLSLTEWGRLAWAWSKRAQA